MGERANQQIARRMRAYWDERARLNAAYFVDTSLSYDAPDMDAFWRDGEVIVDKALTGGPVTVIPGGTAVEIGCGLGRNLRALAKHYDHVVGFDISEQMLAQARTHLDPTIEVRLSDGTSLRPLPDGAADLVLSYTVLQHIPDTRVQRGYLREAARVLAPGGYVVVQWNGTAGSTLGWAARRWLRTARARLGRAPEPYGREAPEFIGARIPRPHMVAALQELGLEVCGTTGDGTIDSWVWARRPVAGGAA